MKVLLVLALITLGFSFPASAEEVEFTPQIDVSAIQTYSDFSAAQHVAWRRYDERQSEAWKQYDAVARESFAIFHAAYVEALSEARTADREHYFEWLDVKERLLFDRRWELEGTVPALITLIKNTSAALAEHETKKDSAWAVYEEVKKQAWDVYEAEKKMAYEAYLAADARNR